MRSITLQPKAMSELVLKMPEYTTDVNSLGTLRILDAIKYLGLEKKTKFYQASTDEISNWRNSTKKTVRKYKILKSPYASQSYLPIGLQTINKSPDIFASNGILFNHENHFLETFPLKGLFSSDKFIKIQVNQWKI